MGGTTALIELGKLLSFLINAYIWVVIIRILLSWFQPNPDAPVTRFLAKVTEPALTLTRRLVPLRLGGLDFSPVILLVFLNTLAFMVKLIAIYIGKGGPGIGVLGCVLLGIIQAIMMLTWFFTLLMIARIVISLVNPSPYNPLVMAIMGLTQPLVSPLRGTIPAKGPGGIDVRALIVLAILLIFYNVVLGHISGPINAWLNSLLNASKFMAAPEPRIY